MIDPKKVNADAGRESLLPRIVGTVANGNGETIGKIVNKSRPIQPAVNKELFFMSESLSEVDFPRPSFQNEAINPQNS